MSIKKTLIKNSLTLAVSNGVTSGGSTKYENITFATINPEATETQIYNTAAAIGTLLTEPVANIYQTIKNCLVKEG